LSVIAIFKNESNILREWLEHYLMEGVDHFFLIDNDSNDNYQQILEPYVRDKLIDLQCDKRTHMQIAHYNWYYLDKLKKESEWVIVVDLDEFMYSRDKYKTIASFLKSLPNDVSQIYVPWKIYGSSGYFDSPSGCVDHFIMRTQYNHVKTNGMLNNDKMLTKTIIRTRYLSKMGIHCSILNELSGREITSDMNPITGNEKHFQCINENVLSKSQLHCNHYPIQSYEWYRNVKMTRGSANTAVNDKVRTITYYNSFDEHASRLQDNELSIKRNQLKIYYGAGTYLDVTRIVYKQFMDKLGKIMIDDKIGFNDIFGDPVPSVEKYLLVRQNKKLTVYPEMEHGLIVINP